MRFELSEELAQRIEGEITAIAKRIPIIDELAYQIAAHHRALPLFRGYEAYYALALTGNVLEFNFDRFEEPFPELLPGRCYGALAVGAQKYPEIGVLLPKRKSDDQPCEMCGGSGKHPLGLAHDDKRVICECGGLGFIPINSEEDRKLLSARKSSVFPDIIPSSYRATKLYQVCGEHYPETEEAVKELVQALFDEPEAECYYFRPKSSIGNRLLHRAIEDGVIADGEYEFFYYERAGGGCNFVRVPPHRLDDGRAEFLFGYEKRDLLWQREIAETAMYGRTKLGITERTRRTMENRLNEETNPFEVKPGLWGFAVDLPKLWRWGTRKWRQWRAGRVTK